MNDLRDENERLLRTLAELRARHRATYAHLLDLETDEAITVHFRAGPKDEVRLYVWSRAWSFVAGGGRFQLNGRDITRAVVDREMRPGAAAMADGANPRVIALDDLPPEYEVALVGWNELALHPAAERHPSLELVIEVNPLDG